MRQISKKASIKLYNSGEWKDWTDEEIVKFQLFQEYLCVPFDVFHTSLEKILNRSVYVHELVDTESLQKEFLGEKTSPTLEEVISMIPLEKRIYFFWETDHEQENDF